MTKLRNVNKTAICCIIHYIMIVWNCLNMTTFRSHLPQQNLFHDGMEGGCLSKGLCTLRQMCSLGNAECTIFPLVGTLFCLACNLCNRSFGISERALSVGSEQNNRVMYLGPYRQEKFHGQVLKVTVWKDAWKGQFGICFDQAYTSTVYLTNPRAKNDHH